MSRKPEYLAYMNSPYWRRRREERILLDGGCCVLCGSTHKLQVHHVTYEHMGTDKEIDDIMTLCEKCHRKVHSVKIDEEYDDE